MANMAEQGRGAGPGDRLLGESEIFLGFQERVSRVAPIDRPVLLVGERGTGKELAAARLHYLSKRWQGPLVALNCAALAPSVLESELFGHEAGAFTGAVNRRQGRFEAAHGGTLFLDEIGQIPLEVQEKILRAVEYQRFERVGGSRPVEVDVRILAATNVDLPDLAARGRFKRDLLDRLAFEVLFLPPLRLRGDDLVLLVHHFAARMAHELGWPGVPEFGEDAWNALRSHDWPGNVRELKNVVERAVARSDGEAVARVDFDPFAAPFATRLEPDARVKPEASPEKRPPPPPGDEPAAASLPEAVRELEVRLLRRALKDARFNQRKAASALGLTYHQFRGLYRKHAESLE